MADYNNKLIDHPNVGGIINFALHITPVPGLYGVVVNAREKKEKLLWVVAIAAGLSHKNLTTTVKLAQGHLKIEECAPQVP